MTAWVRPLGRTGLAVSPIGFGGAPLGIEGYLTAESRDSDAFREQAAAAVGAALDAGITLFDTAPGYGNGRSELVLGELLEPHRSTVVLATKVKMQPGEGPGDWQRSLEASLDRLRTGRVDLLQLHGLSWPDDLAAWVLASGAMDWLGRVKAQGLAQAVGITAEVPSGGLERLIDSGVFDVLQMAYSVIYQSACDYQRAPFGVIPRARARGLGILTMRTATSGVLQRLLAAEFPELDPVRITRLAIRFVLSTPEIDCALVGMTTPGEVEANVVLARDPSSRLDLHQIHDFFEGRTRP